MNHIGTFCHLKPLNFDWIVWRIFSGLSLSLRKKINIPKWIHLRSKKREKRKIYTHTNTHRQSGCYASLIYRTSFKYFVSLDEFCMATTLKNVNWIFARGPISHFQLFFFSFVIFWYASVHVFFFSLALSLSLCSRLFSFDIIYFTNLNLEHRGWTSEETVISLSQFNK